MTEINEMIAMGILKKTDIKCPFHEEHNECNSEQNNNLKGKSRRLRRKLVSDKDMYSTVIPPEQKKQYANIKKSERPNKTNVNIENLSYPVDYAAHHLIPSCTVGENPDFVASELLPYIDKNKGKICCNLGYDINGNENGVWLPALHPVYGEKWAKLENENRQYEYVKESMSVENRQFHHTHLLYNKHVKKHLNNVGKVLDRFHKKTPDTEPSCATCKENENKQLTPPLKPPFKLLGLLNNTSQHLKEKLINKTKHKKYFTSSFCDANNQQTNNQ